MFFSRSSLLTGVASLLSLATLGQAADCGSKGPFGPSVAVGKAGSGGYYCETGWAAGVVVTGLEAWADSSHVNGIQFSFSDGTKRMVGNQKSGSGDQFHKSVTWGVGDTVTQLDLWKSNDGRAVSKIEIKTSNGQTMEIGYWAGKVVSIPINSGIMLGAQGGTGDFIDNITFLFLASTVGKAEITGLDFKENLDEWNKKNTGVDRSFNVADVYVINPNKEDTTYWFRNKKDMTNTKELSSSQKNAFGVSVAVGGKAKVPFFGELSTTVTTSYSYEDMQSQSTSKTDTYTVQWEQTAVIKPGRAVYCRATAQTGTFKSDYTSTVTVTLATGQKFDIKQPGSFTSTGWASGTSVCKDIDAKDAPAGSVIAKRGMTQFFA